ncbi:MAG: hypothetical protein QXT63_02710 [Thermoplasmata archaeon]
MVYSYKWSNTSSIFVYVSFLLLLFIPSSHALETEIGSDFTDNTGKVYEGEYIAYGVRLQKDERFTVHFEVKEGKELDLYIISSLYYLSYKGNATQISGATSYLRTRLADHTQTYATKDEKYYIVVDNKDNGVNDSKPVGIVNYTLSIRFFEKRITQNSDDRRPFIALAFIVLIVGLTFAALRTKLVGKKGDDLALEDDLQFEKKKSIRSNRVVHEKLLTEDTKSRSTKANLEKTKKENAKVEEKKSENREIPLAIEELKSKTTISKPISNREEHVGPKPLVVEEIDKIQARQDLELLSMNKRLIKRDESAKEVQDTKVSKQKLKIDERKELSKGEVDKKAEEIRDKLKKEAKEVSKGPIVCEKCGARIYAKRLTCPECNSKLRR